MKKILKIFLIFLGLAILIFCLYLYKLRSLALEDNRIFELRCTSTNPPLIAYKNSFLKFADSLQSPQDYEEGDLITFYNDYIAGMRKYVVEENKWLETNKKYINRWDFKIIEPWYIQQAAGYQQNMYQGYRDDAQTMLNIVDYKESNEELLDKQTEARKRRDDAIKIYYDFFDYASGLSDWRKFVGYLPVPDGCNKENLVIPDTSGSIDWNGTPTPPPKTIPGFEDISG